MRPIICGTLALLNQAMRDGKNLPFEGAQGTLAVPSI
jgi:adenylosuccinate synthase